MNRYVQLAVLFAATVFAQNSCASGAGGSRVPDFTGVRDKNWKLMEVRSRTESAGGKDIIFQRSMLTQEELKDVFTLRFDAERVSGAGHPNRYFAPYTLTEKQGIDIKPMAGTLMAPLFEPEQLKEREFFAYLENTDQWNLVKGNLELRSKDDKGAEVVLVFSLAD
jgi:heat shock protein HslJ